MFMPLILAKLARAAAMLALAVPLACAAQSYPTKAIRLIIPFPPGGTTDIVGRVVADKLSRELGQSVIVENRGGGGGSIGATAIAQAAPDGYTLGMATVSTHGVNPAVTSKLAYDPVRDFIPITNLVSVPNVVAVHPSVKARDMKEFLALLRAQPGKLSYASSGTASIGHMMGELFKATTKTYVLHIPYRGAGPALNDVVSGQVEVIFDNLPSSLPFIQSGKLRALAVAAPKRLEVLPNVPTFDELGLKPVNDMVWYGFVAPAKTPDEVITKIHDTTVKVLALPDVIERFKSLGATPIGNSPKEYAAQIQAELAKWRIVAKQQSITLEQ